MIAYARRTRQPKRDAVIVLLLAAKFEFANATSRIWHVILLSLMSSRLRLQQRMRSRWWIDLVRDGLSEQRDQLALGDGVAIDVSLRGVYRLVAG
jgi:hypothetical protein